MSSRYPRRTFLKLSGATVGAAALGTSRTAAQELAVGAEDLPLEIDVRGSEWTLADDLRASETGPLITVTAPDVTLDGGGFQLVNEGGPAIAFAPTATTCIMNDFTRVTGSGTSVVNFGLRNYVYCVSVEQTTTNPELPGLFGAGHGAINFGSASRFELVPFANNAGNGMYVPSFEPELEPTLFGLAGELGVGDVGDGSGLVDAVRETEPAFNSCVGSLFVNNGLDGYCQRSPWTNFVGSSYAAQNGGSGFAYHPPAEEVDLAGTSDAWRTLGDVPGLDDAVRSLVDDIADNISAVSRLSESTAVGNAGHGAVVEQERFPDGFGLTAGYDLSGAFLSNGGDGVRVEGSLGTRITRSLSAGNAGDGLSVRESADFVASETTSVENGAAGVSVRGSSGIELSGYISMRNLFGVDFLDSTESEIRRVVDANNDRGVRMSRSSELTFEECFVGLNGDGIELIEVVDSVFSDNHVFTNGVPAFNLGMGTTGNELVDNRLKVFGDGVEKVVEEETGANDITEFDVAPFWERFVPTLTGF